MPNVNFIQPLGEGYGLSGTEAGLSFNMTNCNINQRQELVSRPGYLPYGQQRTHLTADIAKESMGFSQASLYYWKSKGLLLAFGASATLGNVRKYVPATNEWASIGTYLQVQISSRFTFAETPGWLYFTCGGKIMRTDGTTVSEESSPAPANCTHVAAIDGMVVANSVGTGSWYYAEPDPVSVTNPLIWAATGLTAEASPDPIIAIHTGWREVYLFGTNSIEIWYNTGGATVFERLDGAYFEIGVWGSGMSIAKIDNSFFFLDNQKNVVVLTGRTPQIISNTLSGFFRETDNFDNGMSIFGNYALMYTGLSAGTSYRCAVVFDTVLKTWHTWLNTGIVDCLSGISDVPCLISNRDSNVYRLEKEQGVDFFYTRYDAIPCQYYSPCIAFGTNKDKEISNMDAAIRLPQFRLTDKSYQSEGIASMISGMSLTIPMVNTNGSTVDLPSGWNTVFISGTMYITKTPQNLYVHPGGSGPNLAYAFTGSGGGTLTISGGNFTAGTTLYVVLTYHKQGAASLLNLYVPMVISFVSSSPGGITRGVTSSSYFIVDQVTDVQASAGSSGTRIIDFSSTESNVSKRMRVSRLGKMASQRLEMSFSLGPGGAVTSFSEDIRECE